MGTAACTVIQAGPKEMAGKWCLVACLVAATVLATRAAADKPAQDGEIAESQSILKESNIHELEQIRQQREALPGKTVQQRSKSKKGGKGKRGKGKEGKAQRKRGRKGTRKQRKNQAKRSKKKKKKKKKKNSSALLPLL